MHIEATHFDGDSTKYCDYEKISKLHFNAEVFFSNVDARFELDQPFLYVSPGFHSSKQKYWLLYVYM